MNVKIALGKLANIRPTIGMKFPNKNVAVVSARPCNDGVISNSPSARFPNTSLNAAFIEAKEPVKVSEASLAVVPVMPRLSWTACIALTVSAKSPTV